MWAYGSGWGQGYASDPNSYVSTGPSYDPYSNNFSNSYVATDPNYDPYSSNSGSGMSMGNIWGSLISGVAGYAGAKANADAMEDQSKLSIEAKKAMLEKQREYDMQDRKYAQGAVSNWSRYFGSD
jgi:hypothetical protein